MMSFTILENSLNEYQSNDAPVIAFLDELLADAGAQSISDIHIEPYANQARIRFREDGLLREVTTISLRLANRIALRLKILANLDIAEKRLPQDGRLRLASMEKIDLRISTCPTLHGEKITLRLLNPQRACLRIDELGLMSAQKQLLIQCLQQPQGLILVTGPTGSGKTNTLYAALDYLNRGEKNIVSIEDPVEIELHGLNQININHRIGLDFATVLRHVLRQDPDIIMVGEIRDVETAHIALQAAQTGHLLLATLHANHSRDALSRLQAMGVDITQFMPALQLIIAQRLVRMHCTLCKGHHCHACRQGYRGRMAIFEMLALQPSDLQTQGTNLWESGLQKVQQGLTSEQELRRVLGDIAAQPLGH